jgi:hypothetical protein
MAKLSAFLTALFYCLLLEYWLRDTYARARREAGPLLCEIVLRRSLLYYFPAIGAALPGLMVLWFHSVAPGDREIGSGEVFIWTLCGVSLLFVPWRSPRMEIRQNAIVVRRPHLLLIPWNEVASCYWMPTPGKLCIRRGKYDVKLRVALDEVTSATEVLSEHVEVRDAHGVRLASPTFNIDGSVRTGPRAEHREVIFSAFQFDLRTMFLLSIAVAAAAGWFGISFRSGKHQEQVVARLSAFAPQVHWVGYDVFRLDFSKSAKKPADGDLALLSEFPELHTLDLAGSPITDAGLRHLYALTTLRSISLVDTQVTKKGVDDLKRALPKVYVFWYPGSGFGPQGPTPPPPVGPPPLNQPLRGP